MHHQPSVGFWVNALARFVGLLRHVLSPCRLYKGKSFLKPDSYLVSEGWKPIMMSKTGFKFKSSGKSRLTSFQALQLCYFWCFSVTLQYDQDGHYLT